MADELDVQIKAVEAEIAEVKGEIKKVTEQLEGPELSEARLTVLAEREKGLRAEVQRLGTREQQLRKEKEDLRALLLAAKQQHGAGCRSWPATILCARTLVACLLSCRAP